MTYTKEEIEAAIDYATIETKRWKETHTSKLENDGSNKIFIASKSDFLAGIDYQKKQPFDIDSLSEEEKQNHQLYQYGFGHGVQWGKNSGQNQNNADVACKFAEWCTVNNWHYYYKPKLWYAYDQTLKPITSKKLFAEFVKQYKP